MGIFYKIWKERGEKINEVFLSTFHRPRACHLRVPSPRAVFEIISPRDDLYCGGLVDEHENALLHSRSLHHFSTHVFLFTYPYIVCHFNEKIIWIMGPNATCHVSLSSVRLPVSECVCVRNRVYSHVDLTYIRIVDTYIFTSTKWLIQIAVVYGVPTI